MTFHEKESQVTRASLELLYHISRELTTAIDLHEVLQRVLSLSMQTVGAVNGSIIVLDEEQNPVESAIVVGDQYQEHITQRLHETIERGLAGWVLRNREAALVMDTSRDERWIQRNYEFDGRPAPRSAVSVPLLARDHLVGVMTLVHPSAGFFTTDHLALIQAIADQAGIAVLNARLYAESQRQARVMTALVDSAGMITASLNLEDVLAQIMEQIRQVLNVKAVSLALVDQETNELVFRAATGGSAQEIIGRRLQSGQGIAGWVANTGESLIVPDVHQDTRFYQGIDQNTGFATQAIICAPIRYQGEVIGVLEALNPVAATFDPDALTALTGIGSLAGTAIRHALLFEEMQAAHHSYQELFEGSIDPILITDWEGKILEVNRIAVVISDYSKEDLRKLTIDQLHTANFDRLGENFTHLNTPQTISYESSLCTRSGHAIPIEVYVCQVKIDKVSQLQWTLRDITERKNLDTMRNDLISMIYHDLRSPLANVFSSLDVLETMLPKEAEPMLRPLLDIALRSTERIQRLTDSLLDMSRLEAGYPIGKRELIDPTGLMMEAIDIILPAIKGKGQTLDLAVPPELPQVMVDPDMIRRVISNLLENAAKFTPAGGKIQIGARRVDNLLEIWVADNGPGIPSAERERIFDKFSRLSTDVYTKGLGLGLAYCRLAILAHEGRIWVESEPGAGARFIFTLHTANNGG